MTLSNLIVPKVKVTKVHKATKVHKQPKEG